MTEYFRITGKNNILFDAGPTGNYLFPTGRSPRKLSTVLTRQEVLSLLPRLPLGIRPMALQHGLSVITMELNIRGVSDTDMESKEHDLVETLVETELYFSNQGKMGTRAVLTVKSDGAVNTSYKSVFYGVLDELDARDVLGAIIKSHSLEGLRLVLYCEPHWRPETAIELGPNEIKTPSFEEDSNADGLADNWTKLNLPTTTIENTIVLHGCDSQKVVTRALVGDGIKSAIMTAPAGVASAVCYAWICRPAVESDIRVELYEEGVGVVAFALFNTAGWETEGAKDGVNTFYRIVVSTAAGITPANTYSLRIWNTVDTITTFYVDETFWKWGTTTAPDEWIDHYTVDNHYDGIWDAQPPHKNYLDVDGLKGDVDARIFISLDATVGASYRDVFQIARRTRGAPCALVHFREAEHATSESNWANRADAARSNGNDKNDTANASGWANWLIVTPSVNLRGRFRILARAFTNDIVNTKLRVGVRFWVWDVYKYNPWKLLPLVNQYDYVDLGTVFLDPIVRGGSGPNELDIRIEYQKDAIDAVCLDCIMLLPEDESVMQLDQSRTLSGQHVFDDTGDFRYWGMEFGGLYLLHAIKSSVLTLAPDRENRLFFVEHWDDGRWHIHHEVANWFVKATLKYLPQFVSPLE